MIFAAKSPTADEDFELDWTNQLQGDLIVTSVWAEATGILVLSNFNIDSSSKKTSARIGGGVLGTVYIVTNTVTLVSGQVLLRHIRLEIIQE